MSMTPTPTPSLAPRCKFCHTPCPSPHGNASLTTEGLPLGQHQCINVTACRQRMPRSPWSCLVVVPGFGSYPGLYPSLRAAARVLPVDDGSRRTDAPMPCYVFTRILAGARP